jgi:hypothetical protein
VSLTWKISPSLYPDCIVHSFRSALKGEELNSIRDVMSGSVCQVEGLKFLHCDDRCRRRKYGRLFNPCLKPRMSVQQSFKIGPCVSLLAS